LLHPVVSGPEIQRFTFSASDSYLLYPYEGGNVLREPEFRTKYPFAYKYLKQYEDILSARTSLRNDRFWFELSEKRDVRWLGKPKLLTRDLALRASFAPDVIGDMFLVGGTAVVPMGEQLLKPLLCYLNSRLVNWYLTQSTPMFRADFVKFEPQHISQLPVPRALIEDAENLSRLNALADLASSRAPLGEDYVVEIEDQIEEVIVEMTGIDVRKFG
ncbi:MAG: TaqI-like C-terminal specificity domain-containing protein, partial [Fimbriimonas sp.]|nr:TaqI-like C-terminal specificity domain-containing protein [Fimbriimonas sp.]